MIGGLLLALTSSLNTFLSSDHVIGEIMPHSSVFHVVPFEWLVRLKLDTL